jgi:hypothetical protein
MSLIDEAVRAVLLANSTVYGLVGTRIYPLQLPLDCTFPALTYSFPSDNYKRVARPARLQIDCWAEDFTECKNLKNAVETALDGYSGTVSGINIEGIFPISPYDMAPDETGLFHIPYDFKIIYRT